MTITVEFVPFGTPIPQDENAVFVLPNEQGFWSFTTLAGASAIRKSGRPLGGSQDQQQVIEAAKRHCHHNALTRVLVLTPAHALLLAVDPVGLGPGPGLLAI